MQVIIEESTVRKLTQKLKTQGDISPEEAEQMYFVTHSLMKFITNIPFQWLSLSDLVLYLLLSKDYPLSALEDWHKAIAHKIEAGQSGNFIFSMKLVFGLDRLYDFWVPAFKALGEYGCFEDRVETILANQQMYNSFPEYFQKLFKWDEYDKLYVLKGDRVGFFHYPQQDPESGKTYTISQFFKKLFLFSSIIPQEKMSATSPADAAKYILEYLKQKTSYAEIEACTSHGKEFVMFIDAKSILITKKAFEVSIEELIENAIEKNIIDKNMAEKFIMRRGQLEDFPDEEFAEACMKYIDDRVKMKLKWKATQEEVEESNEWLEEVR